MLKMLNETEEENISDSWLCAFWKGIVCMLYFLEVLLHKTIKYHIFFF